MSFTIVCDECGSENVNAFATTDMEVILICKDCNNTEEHE